MVVLEHLRLYHDGSYSLLFGKGKLRSFEIPREQYFSLLNKLLPLLGAALELAPYLKASKLNKLRGTLIRGNTVFEDLPAFHLCLVQQLKVQHHFSFTFM